MAQSTQWGHVERGQFTKPHVYWAGLVLLAVNQYCAHSFARTKSVDPDKLASSEAHRSGSTLFVIQHVNLYPHFGL